MALVTVALIGEEMSQALIVPLIQHFLEPENDCQLCRACPVESTCGQYTAPSPRACGHSNPNRENLAHSPQASLADLSPDHIGLLNRGKLASLTETQQHKYGSKDK
jgi:hypothetical protein